MSHALSWVEIDAAALRQNLAAFAQRVGRGVRLCPVVKANAYGHGLATVARLCAPRSAFFAVASLDEAVQLRDAHVAKPVLNLGYVPLADLAEAVRAGFHLTVSSLETLTALDAAARQVRRRAAVHLELETGTHRLGFTPVQLAAAAELVHRARPRLVVAGASTHFANIEDTTDHGYARRQLRAFGQGLARLGEPGVKPRLRHAACSAAAILFNETHFDLARIGISLYGHWPSRETLVSSRTRRHTRLALAPVLSWKTRVVQLQDVPAGASVGYGCSYRTTRAARLAVLPVGYWDGFDRGLSNLGRVLIRGREAPIRGRLCMNMCMVDVSDIPEVTLEDEVVLLGAQGEARITAEDMAAALGTIVYEVLTRINPFAPRVVVRGAR